MDNRQIAELISERIGPRPVPFEAVRTLALEIYHDLGGREDDENFADIFEILLSILPLTNLIDDTSIYLDKTWSSYKIDASLNQVKTSVEDLKEIVSKLNQIDIIKLQKFLNLLSFNSDEDIILGDYKHKLDIHVANDKSVDKIDEFWLNGVLLMKKILKDNELEKLRMLLNMTTINNDSVTFNFGNNRKVDIYLRNDGIDDIWVNGHRIVNLDN